MVYWPLPWIKNLASEFAADIVAPSQDLAGAAYRDPEGWQRDFKQAQQRLETLQPPSTPSRLLAVYTPEPVEIVEPAATVEVDEFEVKREQSKARLRQKYHDPHEKAYWLIATACVVVGIASTLTIVKAPPEFEPKFLHIKWQDRMARKIKDYADESGPAI